MKIPLDDFEKVIGGRVLERGKKYFEDGAVDEPVELEPGLYEATVQGSEDYTVRVRATDDAITEYDCDCPYDGGICKHVVALIHQMREEDLFTGSGTEVTGTKRKPTVSERLDKALAEVPREDLVAFVRERCLADESLRQHFFTACAPQAHAPDDREHLKRIRSQLRAIAGRQRFIDWRGAGAAGDLLLNVVEHAQKLMDKGHHERALPMITAAIEAGAEAMQDADDSNGDIGGGITSAVELFAAMAALKHEDAFRKRLLREIQRMMADPTVRDHDYDGHFDTITASLIDTEAEAAPLMDRLRSRAQREHFGSSAREALLDLTRRFQGEAAAAALEESYLVHTDVRKKFIEKAIEAKDWERARRLVEDGMKLKRNGGWADEHYWTPDLLRIAQLMKDVPEVIRLARVLLVEGRNGMDHYELLKKHVPQSEWPAFLEDLLKDLHRGRRQLDHSLLAAIYAAEERWDDVMEIARKDGRQTFSFHPVLDQYEKELASRFKAEVCTILAERAEHFASTVNPKNHDYVQAVSLLRRVKQHGDHQLVTALADEWRVRLKRRRGLMEELGKL